MLSCHFWRHPETFAISLSNPVVIHVNCGLKNLKLESMEELQGSGSKIKCNKIFGQRGT